MSTSNTTIANLALAFMREPALLGTLDGDNDPRADALNRIWVIARQDTITDVRPSFAKKQVLLTRDATAPTFEYDFGYILPTDYLFILKFNGITGRKASEQFVRMARNLLTNADTVSLTYVADETNTSYYDTKFEIAFAYKLAYMAAPQIRGNEAEVEYMRKEYDRAKSEAAKFSYSQQKLERVHEKQISDSILYNSRITGVND